MFFSCPVCGSSAVEPAGRTETYQSILCSACQAWSTVPLPAARPVPPPVPRKPPREG